MRRTTGLGLGLALCLGSLVGSGGFEARALGALAPQPPGASGGFEARALGALAPQPPGPAVPPLAGRVVVIDPGHQLGNHNFPRKINRLVPAGGFRKACNTTGTATNRGYAEATFAWRVARRLQARLVDLGAKVVLTRTSNREDRWGPCSAT